MRRKKSDKVFALREHATGQWTVRIDGQDHDLGLDREKAKRRY